MHISVSLRVLGILLMLFSSAALGPFVVAVLEDDRTATAFAYGIGITFLAGLFMWLPVRNVRHELRIRDGFLSEVAVPCAYINQKRVWALRTLRDGQIHLLVNGLSYQMFNFLSRGGCR